MCARRVTITRAAPRLLSRGGHQGDPAQLQLVTGSGGGGAGAWRMWGITSWAMAHEQALGTEVSVVVIEAGFLFAGYEAPIPPGSAGLAVGVPVGMVRAYQVSNATETKLDRALPERTLRRCAIRVHAIMQSPVARSVLRSRCALRRRRRRRR